MMLQSDEPWHLFNEKDPQQLKKVVETLIARTRTLLANLQQTWEQLEQVRTEKDFWKDSYFNLRNACEQYVQRGGLTPFNYIASLEEQLKKEKVYKSCLEEKFKVMSPNSHSHPRRPLPHHEPPRPPSENVSAHQNMGKSLSSTFIKETPQRGKYQNKHKIGPKSIQFFKFGEQKHAEMATKR